MSGREKRPPWQKPPDPDDLPTPEEERQAQANLERLRRISRARIARNMRRQADWRHFALPKADRGE